MNSLPTLETEVFDSPIGPIWAASLGGMLAQIVLRAGDPEVLDAIAARRYSVPTIRIDTSAFGEQAREYFARRRTRFTLPYRLEADTPFQRSVLTQLERVDYGQVVTYRRLAELAGCPGAARAVGQAMARNRLPLVIPCHRVVSAGWAANSSDSPGGYGGGVEAKRFLLELENPGPPP